jgi:hypothetical protein
MPKAENCFNCVYSQWDRNQAAWNLAHCVSTRPLCANHPESLGRSRPTPLGGVCRNYRRRPAEPGRDAKQIPLGDGFYAYVDAADYEWLSQWAWHLHGGYAVRHEGGKRIYMHRAIMQPPEGMVVDHTNRNTMDNTRESLLVCTQHENLINRSKRNGASSRYRGVSYNKRLGKWGARILFEGTRLWLGWFVEEVEAARAYDRKAVELFGEFARLNFPEEWPPERRTEVHAKRAGDEE